MAYFWAALNAVCVAGAVCFSRKKILERPLQGRAFYLELAGAAAAGLLLGWLVQLRVGGSALASLRLLFAAAALAGAARCDIQERKIPNLFPAALLAGFVLCSVLDAIFQRELAAAGFLSGLISGGVVYLALRLCQQISHGGIGGGDIKLMAALFCLIGLYGGFCVLLFAQLSALLVVAVLLLLHRLTVKDSIPFAPFFYLGLLVTVWLGRF